MTNRELEQKNAQEYKTHLVTSIHTLIRKHTSLMICCSKQHFKKTSLSFIGHPQDNNEDSYQSFCRSTGKQVVC